MRPRFADWALLCMALFPLAAAAQPLSTTFTYQGQLNQSNAPLDAAADLEFRLFDAPSGGTQVGNTALVNNVNVVDGLFTASVDCGSSPFNGNQRWLQVAVRSPAGSGIFTTLSPRQPMTAVPYALYALTGPGSGDPWAVNGNDVFNTNTGNVGIGTSTPGEKLTVAGRIHSTSGGVRYPDGTLQSTAGGACVTTIADLRALAIPAPAPGDPATVLVLGYYAPNDLGGGEFFWDAASTELDDGGIVISSNSGPPSGRWKRVLHGPVHAAWWGIPYPGSGPDTFGLQAALNAAAGRGIVFDQPLTYRFDPPLFVPDSVRIENNGAEFVMHSSIGPEGALTLGQNVTANLVQVRVPAGISVQQVLHLGRNNDIERVVLKSDVQLNNNLGNLDGALQIRTQHVRVGTAIIERFDKPILVYLASDVVIEHLALRGYVLGAHIRESAFFHLKSGVITEVAPSATFTPGHNGILIEDSTDGVVSDMIVYDAGEHAVRVGGNGSSARLAFNNIQSIRPGGCGLKLRANPGQRIRDVQINGLTVVDAGAGSAQPTFNQDGLRLEGCSYVTANGVQVEAQTQTYSAHDGIWVVNSDMVTINGPRVSDAFFNGIDLSESSEGTVNSVFINNPTILVCGSNGILFNFQNAILRDIIISRCYIRNFHDRGIKIIANFVNQPVILDGFVRNDVGISAFFSSVNDPDIHNNLIVY
jgi:hypothetical protein